MAHKAPMNLRVKKFFFVSEEAGRRIYCIQKFRASNFEDDMRCMNLVQPVTTRLLRCLEC